MASGGAPPSRKSSPDSDRRPHSRAAKGAGLSSRDRRRMAVVEGISPSSLSSENHVRRAGSPSKFWWQRKGAEGAAPREEPGGGEGGSSSFARGEKENRSPEEVGHIPCLCSSTGARAPAREEGRKGFLSLHRRLCIPTGSCGAFQVAPEDAG